jgi:hypothetical protein
VLAYNLGQGTIRGVDVSGLTLAAVVFIPGNVLAGNWQHVVFIDAARPRSRRMRSPRRSAAPLVARSRTSPSS